MITLIACSPPRAFCHKVVAASFGFPPEQRKNTILQKKVLHFFSSSVLHVLILHVFSFSYACFNITCFLFCFLHICQFTQSSPAAVRGDRIDLICHLLIFPTIPCLSKTPPPSFTMTQHLQAASSHHNIKSKKPAERGLCFRLRQGEPGSPVLPL